MSVIVEVKEKTKAVTNEKVLKGNLGWHLTALIFWLPAPSFSVIWASFNLVSGKPREESRHNAGGINVSQQYLFYLQMQ